MLVGLYGNPFVVAKSLAKLIPGADSAVEDMIAMIRGCVIGVEETTSQAEPTVELTLTFERAGKQSFMMDYVNNILEDVIDLLPTDRDITSKDFVAALIDYLPESGNIYTKKMVQYVKRHNVDCTKLLDLKRDDGHLNLAYLYVSDYIDKDVAELYNQAFVAVKHNVIKEIESSLTSFNGATVVCKNNCMTITYKSDINYTLFQLFNIINSSELINTCLTSLNIQVPSTRDLTFALPTMSDDSPDYLNTLYDCDYILYCDSSDSLKVNRDKFLSDLKERMVLAPDTKIDYILLNSSESSSEEILLSKSLAEADTIPVLKTLLGDPESIKWDDKERSNTDYFSHNSPTDEDTLQEGAPEEKPEKTFNDKDDFICYEEDSGKQTNTYTPTVNFDLLKKELVRVGLSGFKSLKVRGWGEVEQPLSIDVVKASDIKTAIFDDYDVAKVSVGDKEVAMYYMDELNLSELPEEYIREHVKAEKAIMDENTLQDISADFTTHNIGAVQDILDNTKADLLELFQSYTQQELSRSYIQLILGDNTEIYSSLKKHVIESKLDYKINSSGTNAYVSSNIKICLLKALYDSITVEARKLWKHSVDYTLFNESVSNYTVIKKLLEKLL